MKRLAILGCTGSIGVTTLDLVARFRDGFEVIVLAAGNDLDSLEKLLAADRWARVQAQSCLPVNRAQLAAG